MNFTSPVLAFQKKQRMGLQRVFEITEVIVRSLAFLHPYRRATVQSEILTQNTQLNRTF
jgi:hypothetical protein